jgi:hypothetical protein
MTTPPRPVDMRADSLLWLVNRVVFHPRGYALGTDQDGRWYLLGDGTEPWVYGGDGSDEAAHLARIRELMP